MVREKENNRKTCIAHFGDIKEIDHKLAKFKSLLKENLIELTTNDENK